MATVVDILADMGTIVASMEAITPKLQNPKLRPSGQQVTQLHELVARIREHAQCLDEELTACAPAWRPKIFKKSDELMSRAQPAIRAAAEGQVRTPIFRRNLVAIFPGHSASTVDSPRLKARKARKVQKGRKIRRLGTGAILAWAVSLQPSKWEEMDDLVFNDVATQMVEAGAGGEPMAEIALNTRDTIRDLAKEKPFCDVASFGRFVQEVEELAHRSEQRRLSADLRGGESHVPASPDAVPASPDAVAASPDAVAASPDAVPASPDAVPASPDAVAAPGAASE